MDQRKQSAYLRRIDYQESSSDMYSEVAAKYIKLPVQDKVHFLKIHQKILQHTATHQQ